MCWDFNNYSPPPRQALHAKSLGFDHPKTGERLFFESPLPYDMKELIDKWRHYAGHRLSDESFGGSE